MSARKISQRLNGKKPPRAKSLNEMARRGAKKRK